MKKVALGSTGIVVSPLIFGTLPLGPLQAGLSAQEGGRLIRHALESGVQLIDTAELYGTYPHIRHALEGYRGDALIATKTHAADGATARAHVERALRELGRECLDIVHIHGARLQNPFVDRSEVLETLLEMKTEGKIAHVGLSTHYISAVRMAGDHPDIEVIHPLINRNGMGILDGTAGQMAEAIDAAACAGKGIYAMKALAGGNLIESARESFAYVLSLAGVHGLAVGMLSEQEIDANIGLFSEGGAPDTDWAALESRRRRLKIMDQFCKGCGACVPACTNHALHIVDGKVALDEAECILCGYCAAACPDFIIRVV